MYAIIVCGGKQYKVSAGDSIKVELLKKTEVGATVEVDVLMVNNEG
ncbi:MAG: bL21 family ribosomal protein, partial [Clostridia bacterium]|nr:bL21 family ribosomal protein [Clostridia bacterium]